MNGRQAHLQQVQRYLQKQFSARTWTISLPHGSGKETYFARSDEREYFVKVGAPVDLYLAMAETGLTPPVLAAGQLDDGTSILVQPLIAGGMPSRLDFQNQLEKVALHIHAMHTSSKIQSILPSARSTFHKDAGQQALNHLHKRWERYKSQVPGEVAFVDNSLDRLGWEIGQFTTDGLAASHHDICNANWLFTSDRRIYIIDLDSMGMDDPAADMGALLWWYYPPQMRERFLKLAGYPYDDEFKIRMRVRMSLHCLQILLPREQSFDAFRPDLFPDSLTDFRAILSGEENPQGYTT
jgi:hypothetical protein